MSGNEEPLGGHEGIDLGEAKFCVLLREAGEGD